MPPCGKILQKCYHWRFMKVRCYYLEFSIFNFSYPAHFESFSHHLLLLISFTFKSSLIRSIIPYSSKSLYHIYYTNEKKITIQNTFLIVIPILNDANSVEQNTMIESQSSNPTTHKIFCAPSQYIDISRCKPLI